MTVLVGTAAAVLAVAAFLVLVRMTLGPTMLDRALSFDVLIAVAICAVAVDAALRRTAENLPLGRVATLLGVVGSVAVARFTPGSDDVEDEEGEAL